MPAYKQMLQEILNDARSLRHVSLGAVLGEACPCEGCHRSQRRILHRYATKVGQQTVVARLASAIDEPDPFQVDNLFALDVISRWLEGKDIGAWPRFPPVLNSAVEQQLQRFEPPLAQAIVRHLVRVQRLVESAESRPSLSSLRRLLASHGYATSATRVENWLAEDARVRGVNPRDIDAALEHHVPARLLVGTKLTDPFDARWNRFVTNRDWGLMRFYFDTSVDRAALLERFAALPEFEVDEALDRTRSTRKVAWRRLIRAIDIARRVARELK